MKKILFICVLVLMTNLLLAYNITYEKGLEKYKEVVDKEFGQLITDVVKSREAALALFEESDIMTEEIAYLLSYEKENAIFSDFIVNIDESQVVCNTLNNIKIMSYEEAKKKPSLSTGYICYEFVENDGVNLIFSPMASNNEVKDCYFPILINKQGEIVKKKELLDGIITVCGNSSLKGPLMVLDTVNEVLTKQLRIEYPFGRWYNEGMNFKVTSLALHKVNSPLANDFDKLFAVSDESKTLKDKVNLWAFPQVNLLTVDDYPMALSTANIQYSCELMDKVYAKIGREGFHKLNAEIKYAEMLSNEEICKIANTATNIDLQSMLLEYMPSDVKSLLDKNKRASIEAEAKKFMENKQYKEAIPVLNNILAADPYDISIRFNLAKCYRVNSDSVNSDKQIFIAANASIPNDLKNISFFGEPDIINNIIVGKYLFMSEVFDTAEEILKQAYEIDKSPDIKQILDSISLTKENKRKALYGGN